MGWQIIQTEEPNFCTVSTLLVVMLYAEIHFEYTGPALQTKVSCYLYCRDCTEGKYKQSSEKGNFANSISELKKKAFP